MPQSAQIQRLLNLAVVLVVLVLLLTGLCIMQSVKQRQHCLDVARASQFGAQARLVEIREFRRLGALTRASEAFSVGESQARDESYNKMADALQVAVDNSLRPADCAII